MKETVEKISDFSIEEIKNKASQGNPHFQYLLGCKYATGEMGSNATDPDYPKAIELIRKAANGGSCEAQYTLGCMYAQGHGATQDYQKAYFWVYLSQIHLHGDELPHLKQTEPFKQRIETAQTLKKGITTIYSGDTEK